MVKIMHHVYASVVSWRSHTSYIITLTPRGLPLTKVYVDVPVRPRNFDFLYTNFSPNYPPISIPFSIERHLVLPKLGVFDNNLLKIHLIYVIGAHSSRMKTHWSIYQISRKSTQKGRHIIRIPCQYETNPGPYFNTISAGLAPLLNSD